MKLFFTLAALLAAASPMLGQGQDHKIIQTNKTFSQADITIKAGESILFVNADEVTHNVYSVTPGMTFDLQRQAPGASSSMKFSKPGTAQVQCAIHPKMKLTVHVQK